MLGIQTKLMKDKKNPSIVIRSKHVILLPEKTMFVAVDNIFFRFLLIQFNTWINSTNS